MTALFDTSIVIAGGVKEVADGAISVVTIGELETGLLTAKSVRERAARHHRLRMLLERAVILPIDTAVASSYGELRAESGRQPSNDLWIAATAVAFGLELITADRGLASLVGVTPRRVT